MKLTSPSFKNNELLDKKYSVYGEGIFPGLDWKDIPEGTKSLAIIVHDPDAPTNSGFWHLQMLNVSPNLNSIPVGSIDQSYGILRNNDYDSLGYTPPGTPEGRKHRYNFIIYALPFENIIDVMDANLPFKHSVSSSRAIVGFFLEQNNIGKATLTGIYDNR